MFGGSGISLADIAAVTKGNNENDGFGNGNGGWWVLIILLALFGGFGNNGWGNGNRNNNCCEGSGNTVVVPVPSYGYGGGGYGASFTDAALQRGFDTQTIINKLDGINAGICSLGYDQLNQMNGLGTQIMQTGFGLQQGLNNNAVAAMQSANALSTQLANCCCENRQGQADIKYAMATDTCAITTAIREVGQQIMQNDNANYRQLHDENVQLQMQAYRDQITAKDQLINSLNLAQSQANQNQFFANQLAALKDDLSPCPKPAYWVQNPNCCQGPWGPFGNNGCGCNNWNSGCCN